MAYAAYRDHEVLALAGPARRQAARFHVLPVTVHCVDAWRVRQALSACPDAGVVRCQVLLHEGGCTTESRAPRARLLVRLAPGSYVQVLQAVLRAVPSGELGSLVSWREHLRQCAQKAPPMKKPPEGGSLVFAAAHPDQTADR